MTPRTLHDTLDTPPTTACEPARAVLRLLGHPAADTLHPADVFAEAITAIDYAIDAEAPDEAASTRYFLTGRAQELDWITTPSSSTPIIGGAA